MTTVSENRPPRAQSRVTFLNTGARHRVTGVVYVMERAHTGTDSTSPPNVHRDRPRSTRYGSPNDRYPKVRSWLGVAWCVIDLLERPLGGEPVADGAPERSVEFRSSCAHPRQHVRISRSGPIGIDVDAPDDIARLWL